MLTSQRTIKMSIRTPLPQPVDRSDDMRSPIVKEMRKLDRLLKDVWVCTCILLIPSLNLEQITSLKQKQAGGAALLPDQEVKIAREDAIRQSLHHLQQHHPEEAASLASVISHLKPALSKECAPPVDGRFVQDVRECAVDDDMAGACTQQVCVVIALVYISTFHMT
jgi:hypothetical protein